MHKQVWHLHDSMKIAKSPAAECNFSKRAAPLHKLAKVIAAVPQAATLFPGCSAVPAFIRLLLLMQAAHNG